MASEALSSDWHTWHPPAKEVPAAHSSLGEIRDTCQYPDQPWHLSFNYSCLPQASGKYKLVVTMACPGCMVWHGMARSGVVWVALRVGTHGGGWFRQAGRQGMHLRCQLGMTAQCDGQAGPEQREIYGSQ